jgi:3-hydroxybutyrate dehydrogenase
MNAATPLGQPAGEPDLRGKCALVTGSIAGLGYAIAERLAQAGANIVLHGLEGDELALPARAALIERAGTEVIVHHADLNRVDQIEDMMDAAARAFGQVDIVVNNAVVRHFAATEDLRTEQWDASMAVNLSAAFHTARLALPAMRRRGWGRIVNMSSVYGAGGAIDRIGYVTTKTGLIGMTRAIALETATSGITCNAVSPGTVPTPPIVARIARLAQEQGVTQEQAERDYLAQRQPTQRFVSPRSVGALIAFLCSAAGDDITGAVLPIDGGWTAA